MVDLEVFLDICVGGSYVGFGLVVVVVGDVVFDCVGGEEALHFGVELCSECFVVADDEGWSAGALYDVGDGEGFSAACYAEQGLGGGPCFDSAREAVDGLGLVAGWQEWTLDEVA